ncbi:alpha/beta hydrolase [Consotaella salsifontis]|uniref:Phospholipase/carboxylesterase n=1 Tax=Consotaella salsifontis TaxID=1365950 RepID=A0A1T4QIU9_9HYPH|nr:alpha/beta hydrolase [Consotaella salsifontis]SKA03567.1 phospholipase/carboxylesterase [Consotaella salsifontis]
MAELSFIHRFEAGEDQSLAPLLLLHGTGGDERDLLPLGRLVAPGAALLSPRGKVLEGGMPRFFRRLSEGVFDEADVARRAGELADFVAEAREAYGIGAPLALGFSNGANIAAAMLLLHPEALAGAVLLRPMVPLASPPDGDLSGKPILMISGAADPLIASENPARLARTFRERDADLTHETVDAGHGLCERDLLLMKSWMARS